MRPARVPVRVESSDELVESIMQLLHQRDGMIDEIYAKEREESGLHGGHDRLLYDGRRRTFSDSTFSPPQHLDEPCADTTRPCAHLHPHNTNTNTNSNDNVDPNPLRPPAIHLPPQPTTPSPYRTRSLRQNRAPSLLFTRDSTPMLASSTPKPKTKRASFFRWVSDLKGGGGAKKGEGSGGGIGASSEGGGDSGSTPQQKVQTKKKKNRFGFSFTRSKKTSAAKKQNEKEKIELQSPKIQVRSFVASDDSPPTTSLFVNSRTLMGCTDLLLRGVGAPHQCPLGSVASYLILC